MGISMGKLLIILAIVLIIVGGKRLRRLGADLGASIHGLRTALSEEEEIKKTNPDDIGHKGIQKEKNTNSPIS
jgi:sec-independent protein translocase protein TatA